MRDHQDPDRIGDTEEVPPGREGADSGASDAVRIDPDGVAELPDRSHGNDIAGVGPRDPDSDAGEDPSFDEEIDAYRSSRPDRLSDETGGAPHLNRRGEGAPEE